MYTFVYVCVLLDDEWWVGVGACAFPCIFDVFCITVCCVFLSIVSYARVGLCMFVSVCVCVCVASMGLCARACVCSCVRTPQLVHQRCPLAANNLGCLDWQLGHLAAADDSLRLAAAAQRQAYGRPLSSTLVNHCYLSLAGTGGRGGPSTLPPEMFAVLQGLSPRLEQPQFILQQ